MKGDAEGLAALRAGKPVAGVEQSSILAAFAKAAVDLAMPGGGGMLFPDAPAKLAALRAEVRTALGEKALADVCAVIGIFNGITKVADMTGCRLDQATEANNGALAIEVMGLKEWRHGLGVRLTPGAKL